MRGWFRQAAGGLPRQFWFLWTGTLINRLGSFVVIFLAIYLTGTRGLSQSQAATLAGTAEAALAAPIVEPLPPVVAEPVADTPIRIRWCAACAPPKPG